ncbi:MAG: YtxH domain-containing protein [Atopococcus tabaci]|uniref:YtxH domain-containing protein n=1 Tax=Atopococcus tabaci TaxID=269774 RepID=A0AA43UCA1_9LACT|nr:YtxH domain-containing protein [Atopococcus tabaci]
MRIKKFAAGLLVGALGGAVYGLLTTKNSGKENQQKLKVYTEDVKAKAEVVGHDLNQMQDTIQTMRKVAIPQAKQFQNEVDILIKSFQDEAQPRQRRISNQLDKIQKEADDFNTSLNAENVEKK